MYQLCRPVQLSSRQTTVHDSFSRSVSLSESVRGELKWYPERPAWSVKGGETETTDAVFTAQETHSSQAAYC